LRRLIGDFGVGYPPAQDDRAVGAAHLDLGAGKDLAVFLREPADVGVDDDLDTL